MSNKVEKGDRHFTVIEWGILIILVITFIVVLCIYGYHFNQIADTPEVFGWFGDYIGGTTGALLGLASIVFLYRTYKIQISISQRQEDIQTYQQHETVFFRLLDEHRNIVLNMSGEVKNSKRGRNPHYEGYEYIAKIRKDLAMRLSDLDYDSDLLKPENINELKRIIDDIYEPFFCGIAAQMGHYFRHLYHTLKYASDHFENPKEYIDLIQAQMSSDELYLCAINGMTKYGRKKALPLINDFSFIENVRVDSDEVMNLLIKIFYPKTKRRFFGGIKRNIIFVGGIHGVGKSTFVDKVKNELKDFNSLSCSEVLKWKNSTLKTVENVQANQNQLLFNLRKLVDIDKPYLLDGHFCLMNQEGERERVSLSVFRNINPAAIILIHDDVELVCDRLSKRDNVKYDMELLTLLDEDELDHSHDIADELSIPYFVLKPNEYHKVSTYLEGFIADFN